MQGWGLDGESGRGRCSRRHRGKLLVAASSLPRPGSRRVTAGSLSQSRSRPGPCMQSQLPRGPSGPWARLSAWSSHCICQGPGVGQGPGTFPGERRKKRSLLLRPRAPLLSPMGFGGLTCSSGLLPAQPPSTHLVVTGCMVGPAAGRPLPEADRVGLLRANTGAALAHLEFLRREPCGRPEGQLLEPRKPEETGKQKTAVSDLCVRWLWRLGEGQSLHGAI